LKALWDIGGGSQVDRISRREVILQNGLVGLERLRVDQVGERVARIRAVQDPDDP
jgi:hypothetical protein